MRWTSRLLTRWLHRWDSWIYDLSHGRWTATEILAGLPVIFVTSIGVKTGLPCKTPLLAIRSGDAFILVATKFGADHHPDWYFNMKANPRVEVLFKGQTSTYRVSELEGKEREASWAYAVEYYPGYQAYARRANHRHIPVLMLSPLQS